jgi:hypothetical protein
MGIVPTELSTVLAKSSAGPAAGTKPAYACTDSVFEFHHFNHHQKILSARNLKPPDTHTTGGPARVELVCLSVYMSILSLSVCLSLSLALCLPLSLLIHLSIY